MPGTCDLCGERMPSETGEGAFVFWDKEGGNLEGYACAICWAALMTTVLRLQAQRPARGRDVEGQS